MHPGCTLEAAIPSAESPSMDELTGEIATVADNANGLITQAKGELNDISGNMNHLLANLDTMTGPRKSEKGPSHSVQHRSIGGGRAPKD